MPSASTSCCASSLQRRADAAAAAMAPNTAVGWKPALCTGLRRDQAQPAHRLDADRDADAAPRAPSSASRSPAASTAGTMTAPACTGPPSKVSSKSSPWAAVPLTKAAPAALSVRRWPMAVQRPVVVPAGERACT